MIGIIGAMDVEVALIKSRIESPVVSSFANTEFVCGTIENVMVCVAQCSAGKVNAAICTQIMIDRFAPDKIINVGVGCSLHNDVVIKNVVIANDVCEHDMNITALGEPRGYINGINTIKIPTDEKLSEELAQCAIHCGEKIHRGTVASGDLFVSSEKVKSKLHEHFEAICGEMEGGAIGHVCYANDVPFAVIRAISDGGDENALMDYPTFKNISAKMTTDVLLRYLKTQKTQLEF